MLIRDLQECKAKGSGLADDSSVLAYGLRLLG